MQAKDGLPKGLTKWPFKRNSVMRILFQRLLVGAEKKDLEKQVTETAHSWPFMLRVMQRGYAKRGQFTWKLVEVAGHLKIQDLKQHPKATIRQTSLLP